jgi:hypothetical protein
MEANISFETSLEFQYTKRRYSSENFVGTFAFYLEGDF